MGGGKLSRLVYLAPPTPPPPAQYRGLSQALSSANSYCNNIILEYLVVRDVNIILVKLTCNILFGYPCPRGGGQLSRLVYLTPRTGFGSNSVISLFLLNHNLAIFSCKRCEHYFSQTEMFASNVQFGYPCLRGGGQAVQTRLSCPPPKIWVRQCHQSILIKPLSRNINIISVKLRCLHPMVSLVTFDRGLGGWGGSGASCPGWFIFPTPYPPPPPTPGFESGSVISQFLLHHNLGIFSCMRCEQYFSQTDMQHSVWLPLSEGWGAIVQAGLSYPTPRIRVKQCHQFILIEP